MAHQSSQQTHQSESKQMLLRQPGGPFCGLTLHEVFTDLDVAAGCVQPHGRIVPHGRIIPRGLHGNLTCMYQCMRDKTNQTQGDDSQYLCHCFISLVELDADAMCTMQEWLCHKPA